MNVYLASFPGKYMTGYAVVSAPSERDAKVFVRRKVKERLGKTITFSDIDLQLMNTDKKNAEILFDGDY